MSGLLSELALLSKGICMVQDATGKECGLHSGNVVASAAEQAEKEAARDLWDSDSNVQQLSHDQLASIVDGQRDKSTVLVMYAPWCQYSQVRNPIPHGVLSQCSSKVSCAYSATTLQAVLPALFALCLHVVPAMISSSLNGLHLIAALHGVALPIIVKGV